MPDALTLKPARSGGALIERLAVMLETGADADYALIDSGGGRKLERFGALTVIRPEGQAIWRPALSPEAWDRADAIFTGDTDEEGIGRWRFPRAALGETWPMQWDGISYLGRFTSFRHVGVFPEQEAHWRLRPGASGGAQGRPPVLNLFGYTGIASLVAARAGAEVTHVDASKKAIGWARENQEVAGMNALPIRWICEDAVKFCRARGAARQPLRHHPARSAEPTAAGRRARSGGCSRTCRSCSISAAQLLTPKPLFVVLTAYSIRASFFALHALMRDTFAGMGGELESGELIIVSEGGARRLSTSLFSRWVASHEPRARHRHARQGARSHQRSPIRWSRTSARWR